MRTIITAILLLFPLALCAQDAPVSVDTSHLVIVNASPSTTALALIDRANNTQFCAPNDKCIAVDANGKITRDDGLTRDEVIALINQITLEMVAGQKQIYKLHDDEISRYRKIIDLQEEENTLLRKAYNELLDGLKEVQKILKDSQLKPKPATKGKA